MRASVDYSILCDLLTVCKHMQDDRTLLTDRLTD